MMPGNHLDAKNSPFYPTAPYKSILSFYFTNILTFYLYPQMFNYIIYYVALQTQSNVLNELFSAYQQHLAPPNVMKYISLPVAQIGQSTKHKTVSNVLIFH